MRAVQVPRLGGPEVLTEVDLPTPEPGPGQLLVEVEATGVAYADLMMRRGVYPSMPTLPFTPGYDVVGRVVALGPDVAGHAVGDRVAALTVTGGYATYALAPAALSVPVPDGLPAAEVVALVLNYTTARQLLHRVAAVPAGGTVVVLGAAGGVGTAALELCAGAGIRALGVASGDRVDAVTARGGTPVDRAAGDWVAEVRRLAPEGVDAVLDPVGGPSLARSRTVLRRGGVVASYGTAFAVAGGLGRTRGLARHAAALAAGKVAPGSRTALYVITSYADKHPADFGEDLAWLVAELAAGRLAPAVTVLPLDRAAHAQELLESGTVVGKLVLTPSGGV